MLLVYLLIEPILIFLGATSETLISGKQFLQIYMFGSIINCVGYLVNRLILGQGFPVYSMIFVLAGAVCNVILDYVFIYIVGLGVQGAALGTVISQSVSALLNFLFFFKVENGLRFKFKFFIHLEFKKIISILYIGIGAFLMNLGAGIGQLVMNNTLISVATFEYVSAYGIVDSVFNMVFMPVIGLNQGVQPLYSFNIGAKNYSRVKKLYIYTVSYASVIAVLGFIASVFFSSTVASLVTKDATLIELATFFIRRYMGFSFLLGFILITSGFLHSAGYSGLSIALSGAKQILFLIPAIIILYRIFGFTAITFSGMVADGLSTILSVIFIKHVFKDINEKELLVQKNTNI